LWTDVVPADDDEELELELPADEDAPNNLLPDGGLAGLGDTNEARPMEMVDAWDEKGNANAGVYKDVWEDNANWISSGKGNLDEHLQVICHPSGGFVSGTDHYRRTHAGRNKQMPGHTAALIVLDPPYLPGNRLDLTATNDTLRACSWWAIDGCVLIIFIDWMQATPWIENLKKLKWVVDTTRLTITRKNSK
jgi:hypothetical protein